MVEGRGDEREVAQWRRDRENWQVKLDRLAAERDRELARVASRYEEITPHSFPVAVIFVVPAAGGDPMRPRRASNGGSARVARREAHIEWLRLIEVSGPFLSVPVLTAEWPDLEPLDVRHRDALRRAHVDVAGRAATVQAWIAFVLEDLLGWQEAGPVRRRHGPRWPWTCPSTRRRSPRRSRSRDPASGEVRLLGLVSDGLPGGAGARVRLARDPRRPARPAVPRPRR